MRAEALGRRLQAMLGPEAGVGWAEIGDAGGLFPEERRAIARAVPSRRAEFAAGRRAARMALAALGLPEAGIPVGPRRAPVWPEGVAGAITHDRGLALAAVITRPGALGIDLTEAAPLPGETRGTILPHAEEAALSDLEARAAFSAKESLFKAFSPMTETYFGFEAAIFAADLRGGTFALILTGPLGGRPGGMKLRGAVSTDETRLVTSLLVPPSHM